MSITIIIVNVFNTIMVDTETVKEPIDDINFSNSNNNENLYIFVSTSLYRQFLGQNFHKNVYLYYTARLILIH